MNNVKVSIIIPVYGAEKYIERCVRSLMEQTMKNEVEFLFINDCTLDGSMKVLERVVADYPERTQQIRIINHAKNRGIAFTRSEGIHEAKGEYIGWCDSDDWCEPNMFEKMFNSTDNGIYDIVVCQTYRHAVDGVTIYSNLECATPQDYLKMIYSTERWAYFSVLYSKLIRRSVLIENHIYPFEGINRSEDLNVMIRVCCEAKSIAFVKDVLYHYNKLNASSITHVGFKAKEDWRQQSENVNLISNYLAKEKPKKWKTIRAFLQFTAKSECRNAFDNVREYFDTYRTSHWHILKFKNVSLKSRISMFMTYNIWPLFKIRQ